jgi:hypothetical protein
MESSLRAHQNRSLMCARLQMTATRSRQFVRRSRASSEYASPVPPHISSRLCRSSTVSSLTLPPEARILVGIITIGHSIDANSAAPVATNSPSIYAVSSELMTP